MKKGLQLIIDLKECRNLEKLSDKEFARKFLVELTNLIEIKIIFGPEVIYYEHEEKEESGVTGFVIIVDSHIAIHTYPLKKFVYLDIFSCKEFNQEKVIEHVIKTFNPKDVMWNLIKR
jgi:S-adenosylmethionine decarboxylase